MPGSLTKRYDYSRWLWSLGATRKDALALVASYNSRMLRRRLGLRGVATVTAQLRAHGRTLPFQFREASDFTVLSEVFRESQYLLETELQPKAIVDLGANTGLSPMFFHGLFPSAKVLAVEAHPETFARLETNAKRWDNVEVLHAAASGASGDVEFFGSDERGISSSMFRRARGDRKWSVPGVSLAALVDRCLRLTPGAERVDVVKFDIEGAELEVFSRFDDWSRIGVLIGEVHPDLYRGTLEQLLDAFPRHEARVLHRHGARAVVRLDPS